MILKVEDVSYYYQEENRKRYILTNVNAEFSMGKFYTILGESGSGKTTLLSLLSKLDENYSGNIFFDNQNIRSFDESYYRRNKIGIIFQSYNLINYLSAIENVCLALNITDNDIPKNKRKVAINMLDYVGISYDKVNRPVSKLSGGEQQRVAVIRAIGTNVTTLLADEPTGNLDTERELDMINIFKKLAHEYNKCVIVVTHSYEIAKHSDEILYLKNGELSKIGSVEDI